MCPRGWGWQLGRPQRGLLRRRDCPHPGSAGIYPASKVLRRRDVKAGPQICGGTGLRHPCGRRVQTLPCHSEGLRMPPAGRFRPPRAKWGTEGQAGGWDGKQGPAEPFLGGSGGPSRWIQGWQSTLACPGVQDQVKNWYLRCQSAQKGLDVPRRRSPLPPQPPGAWGPEVNRPQPTGAPLLGFHLLLLLVCPTAWSLPLCPQVRHAVCPPPGPPHPNPSHTEHCQGACGAPACGVTGLAWGGCCVRRDSHHWCLGPRPAPVSQSCPRTGPSLHAMALSIFQSRSSMGRGGF